MRHISDRFTAVLDANVLYPFQVRDVLLSLAEAGLYRPVWSAEINEEWTRNLIAEKPDKEATIMATLAAMNEAFPEAIVEGHTTLVPSLVLPDLDDRHVLAAAIHSGAGVIVTENTKHFPPDVLARHGLEIRTADEFCVDTIELYPADAIRAMEKMRAKYRNPPRTRDELLKHFLGVGLVATASALEPLLAVLND